MTMMTTGLTLVYGIIAAVIVFNFILMLFSVYYTPGVTTIYNTPTSQKLFPTAINKIFPSWGYNKLGMYDGQSFKIGQGSFWPSSGKGYIPNKYGSTGASPRGGMRTRFSIPSETHTGWWSSSPEHKTRILMNIYDNSSQHVQYITPIGWWNK
jgi:hypothetical protein